MEEFTYNVYAKVEYDGSRYNGFQIQPNGDTIEGELKKAVSFVLNEDVKIIGSGRTDKGVHALGQIINFYTNKKIDEDKLMFAINNRLPKDIILRELKYVDLDFHSRFQNHTKEYHYLVKVNNFSAFDLNYYMKHKDFDMARAQEALDKFKGEHNFKSFTTNDVDQRKNFVRTISRAEVVKHDDYYEFIFVGNGFLRYQIRKMISIIFDYIDSNIALDYIDYVFEQEDPLVWSKIAIPNGLYLYKVTYGGN